MANTTWNPSDIINATLSNGNLTITNNGLGGAARAIDKQISGKWYWEATLVIGGSSDGVGFATMPAPLGNSSWPGTVLLSQGGAIFLNGAQQTSWGSFGTIANGSVICMAIDLTNQLAWFRLGAAGNWNNTAAANPATGAYGINIQSIAGIGVPVYPYAFVWAGGQQFTANFGNIAFTGLVPSGFTAGWTSGAFPPVNAVMTQIGVEDWVTQAASINERAIVTQAGVEMWASASALIPSQAIVTQIGLEMWTSVPPSIPPSRMKPYAMILA
jgi:hypothetical protein